MNKVFFAIVIACFAILACETPAPATNILSDSIMDSGQPAPDSVVRDTSRN